jgi:hypothetical protein
MLHNFINALIASGAHDDYDPADATWTFEVSNDSTLYLTFEDEGYSYVLIRAGGIDTKGTMESVSQLKALLK